jgi:hypothetical protein
MTIATVLLVLMFGCLIYLTVDWIIDEVKRNRGNQEELERWDALYPNKNERTHATKNKR